MCISSIPSISIPLSVGTLQTPMAGDQQDSGRASEHVIDLGRNRKDISAVLVRKRAWAGPIAQPSAEIRDLAR